MESGDSSLTDEQRSIVEAGVEARQLVIAGPGAGKTHVLRCRLAKLVEGDDVSAGEILVLSFSRAAVGEVKRRVRELGGDTARVRVITFDSLATDLLAGADPDGAWQSASFDERIRMATALVGHGVDQLVDYLHLCVDEVQDLVSVRMRFVIRLLDELDVGFTLLGDPAQAIYDFQLGEEECRTDDGNPAFLRWLRERYPDDLIETTLTENFRSNSDRSRRACAVGALAAAHPLTALHELQGVFDELPALPGLDSLARPLRSGGRTAVLCRTNGQVLATSRALWSAGVVHSIQRPATQRIISPWVAALLRRGEGRRLDRDTLAAMLADIGGPNVEQVWRPLRRVARDGRDIDLALLRQRLAEGIVPDDLHHNVDPIVVASTVHRAKGLEFDRVVIVNAGWEPPYDEDYLSTLFVALSRARTSIVVAEPADLGGGPLGKDHRLDRWYHRGFKPWQRRGIEVRPEDTDTETPFGGGSDPATVQDQLRAARTGDPVTLRLDRMVLGDRPWPRYLISMDQGGHQIGYSSAVFGQDLLQLLGQRPGSYKPPESIGHLRLDGSRSVIGDPRLTLQCGLGAGGAWLVPVVAGLGSLHWR